MDYQSAVYYLSTFFEYGKSDEAVAKDLVSAITDSIRRARPAYYTEVLTAVCRRLGVVVG